METQARSSYCAGFKLLLTFRITVDYITLVANVNVANIFLFFLNFFYCVTQSFQVFDDAWSGLMCHLGDTLGHRL